MVFLTYDVTLDDVHAYDRGIMALPEIVEWVERRRPTSPDRTRRRVQPQRRCTDTRRRMPVNRVVLPIWRLTTDASA